MSKLVKEKNDKTSKLEGFGLRLYEACGGGTYRDVAKFLNKDPNFLTVDYDSVRRYLLNEREPSFETIAKIAKLANQSIHFLITGEKSNVRELGRAIEAYDAEIIDKFELDELRAVRELSAIAGTDVPTAIAEMTRESLISRGLIKVPAELLIESIASYPDKADQYRCVVLGEIRDDNFFYKYSNAQTAQIPKHFNPQENKDEFIHPGFFHAYRVMTDQLTEEGLHRNDLIICLSANFSASLQDSQPVVVPIDKESKILVRRFYRDVLDPNQFIFRPIKGNRPIIRLKTIRYIDMDAVLGIVTP